MNLERIESLSLPMNQVARAAGTAHEAALLAGGSLLIGRCESIVRRGYAVGSPSEHLININDAISYKLKMEFH